MESGLLKTLDNNILDKSTPSLFQIVFSKLPFECDGVDYFSLNIHSTSIPGLDLSAEELRWQGAYTKRPGSSLNFSDLSVDFIVDEYYKNWIFFYKWITFIHNNKDKFTENYPKYCAQASILIKNNWNKNILEIKIIDIWPTSLGDISLTSRSNEDYIEGNVSFSYDRYEIEI